MKPRLFLIAVASLSSLVASAQERTAREYAKTHGIPNRQTAITLAAPHACTLSKQHPCVYYGGDIDPNDPQEDGLINWNGSPVSEVDAWTYTEISVPVASALRIYAAFTNNLQGFGIIDPKTANWDFRIGIHENYPGTSIGSGTSPAELTATGRSAFGLAEYETPDQNGRYPSSGQCVVRRAAELYKQRQPGVQRLLHGRF